MYLVYTSSFYYYYLTLFFALTTQVALAADGTDNYDVAVPYYEKLIEYLIAQKGGIVSQLDDVALAINAVFLNKRNNVYYYSWGNK